MVFWLSLCRWDLTWLVSTISLAWSTIHCTDLRECCHTDNVNCFSSLFSLFISLQCHGTLSKFNAPERAEVLRRRSILLVYLLRSPFYDEYTKWVYYMYVFRMHHTTLRSIKQDWIEKLWAPVTFSLQYTICTCTVYAVYMCVFIISPSLFLSQIILIDHSMVCTWVFPLQWQVIGYRLKKMCDLMQTFALHCAVHTVQIYCRLAEWLLWSPGLHVQYIHVWLTYMYIHICTQYHLYC